DPRSWNLLGTNYRKLMVSLLKAWYGEAATAANEFAFDFIPKPAKNASWMSIYDQALKGQMQGLILNGSTATSIGPDSNRVMDARSKLMRLASMDPWPTTSSEFRRRRCSGPSSRPTDSLIHLRQPQGRRLDQRRRLDLHRPLPGEREPDQAPPGDPGQGRQRSDGYGLLPELVLVLAAQPTGDVQPGIGRRQRPALGSDPARD